MATATRQAPSNLFGVDGENLLMSGSSQNPHHHGSNPAAASADGARMSERELEELRILERERMEGDEEEDDEFYDQHEEEEDLKDFAEYYETDEHEEPPQQPQPQMLFVPDGFAAAAWAQAQAQVQDTSTQANPLAAAAAAANDAALDPSDESRMVLTKEERGWALNIKDVIEADAELDNLTDFMYAQFAIVEQDNVEAAVERAYNLQGFREEYKVRDSRQDGRQSLAELVDLCPGVYMSFCYNKRDGNYVQAFDLAKFDMKYISTKEGVTTWIKGGYYIFTACCPDFESIRRGGVCLFETEGFDWNKNMSLEAFRKVWSELGFSYPIRFQQIKYFHTGMFINLIYSMTRRVLPERLHSKFQVGCQFDRRLDAIYMVPTVERAMQRQMAHYDEALRRRYDNEATFSLGDRDGDPPNEI